MKIRLSCGKSQKFKSYETFKKEADEIIDILVKSKLTVQESTELLGAISELLPYMSSVGTSENDKVTLEIVYDTLPEERPER